MPRLSLEVSFVDAVAAAESLSALVPELSRPTCWESATTVLKPTSSRSRCTLSNLSASTGFWYSLSNSAPSVENIDPSFASSVMFSHIPLYFFRTAKEQGRAEKARKSRCGFTASRVKSWTTYNKHTNLLLPLMLTRDCD